MCLMQIKRTQTKPKKHIFTHPYQNIKSRTNSRLVMEIKFEKLRETKHQLHTNFLQKSISIFNKPFVQKN